MTPESRIIDAAHLFHNAIEQKRGAVRTAEQLLQNTRDLLESNRAEAQKHFRGSIEPPPERTIQKVNNTRTKLQSLGFEHFFPVVLPHRYFSAHLQHSHGMPDSYLPKSFYAKVEEKKYPTNALKIDRGVYLIDTTERPDFSLSSQEYIQDNAMEEFLKQQHIRNKLLLSRKNEEYEEPPVTRFNFSADEINNTILPELSKKILSQFAETSTLRLPRFIELFTIGTIFTPQLGRGNTEEWFGDDQNEGFGVTLVGGKDLRSVRPVWKHHRSPTIGFRPMIFFPY